MDYRDLVYYQRAREVVKIISSETKTWPRSIQAMSISRQLLQAALSIGANIAEGHGRHSGQEYIHFLFIAQGSANEVDHWLNTAIDLELGNLCEIKRLISLNNEVRKMLKSTINTLQNQQRSKLLRDSLSPYSLIPSTNVEDEEYE